MPHQLVLGQAVFSSLLPIRSRPLPCPIHSTAVQPPFPPTAFFAWAAANPALHRPRKRPPSPRCLPPVLSPAAGKGDRFRPMIPSSMEKDYWRTRTIAEGQGPGLLPPAPDLCLRSNYGLPLHPSASASGSQSGELQAIWVTSVRTRREDRSSISSHPLADLGG